MRRFVLSFALVAGLAVAPVALAEEPAGAAAPAKPAKPAKLDMDDPDRIVCTREHVVGSNRPKKVCMTVAQREELRETARRNMDSGPGLPTPPSGVAGAGG
ncbi:MAG: hypothetical protein Q8L23_00940 [Caulobacter sp.]|nr:hypothetical protein [Caulobacter sp.]